MTEPNGITCRLDYIRSIPGVLKLIELVNRIDDSSYAEESIGLFCSLGL